MMGGQPRSQQEHCCGGCSSTQLSSRKEEVLAKEVLVVTLVQINSPSSVVTPLVDLVFT